jgi:hypothetical protein
MTRWNCPGHFLWEAAAWLAHQAGTDLIEFPGGHARYLLWDLG